MKFLEYFSLFYISKSDDGSFLNNICSTLNAHELWNSNSALRCGPSL